MGDTLFFQITLLGIQNVVKRGNSCRRQKPPWCCLSTFSTDSCGEGARQLYPSPQYLYWCLWNPGLSRRLLSPVAPSPLPPFFSLSHPPLCLPHPPAFHSAVIPDHFLPSSLWDWHHCSMEQWLCLHYSHSSGTAMALELCRCGAIA